VTVIYISSVTVTTLNSDVEERLRTVGGQYFLVSDLQQSC